MLFFVFNVVINVVWLIGLFCGWMEVGSEEGMDDKLLEFLLFLVVDWECLNCFFFDLWFVFYIWNMVFYFFVCIFFWSLVLVFLGCGCYSCWCSLKLKRLVVYFDLLFVWSEFFFFLISLIFFEVLYFLYYLFGRFFVYEMSWNLDFLRLVLLNGLK